MTAAALARPRRRHGGDEAAVAGLATLGLSSAVSFRGVGTVFLLDLLCLLIGGWALLTGRALRLGPSGRLILVLMLAWLVGAVVTDAVRGSAPGDYLRGWGRILSFALSYVTVSVLSAGRLSRVAAFLAGLAAATALETWRSPSLYQQIDAWKFGFALPAAVAAVLAASLPLGGGRPPAWLQVAAPLALAAANLAFNYRAMFLVTLAVAAIVLLARAAQRAFGARARLTPLSAGLVVGALVLVGAATVAGYSALAESGALGAAARAKHQAQTAGDLGLLVGGRSGGLASAQAIRDSPWLGHGSWARDRTYVLLHVNMMRRHGYDAREPVSGDDLIPAHSHLLGAWVEAGLAGALFWTVVLLMTGYGFLRLIEVPTAALPLVAFSLALFLWNIPFSPYGAEMRFLEAAQLAVLTWIMETGRRSGARPAWRGRAP